MTRMSDSVCNLVCSVITHGEPALRVQIFNICVWFCSNVHRSEKAPVNLLLGSPSSLTTLSPHFAMSSVFMVDAISSLHV